MNDSSTTLEAGSGDTDSGAAADHLRPTEEAETGSHPLGRRHSWGKWGVVARQTSPTVGFARAVGWVGIYRQELNSWKGVERQDGPDLKPGFLCMQP